VCHILLMLSTRNPTRNGPLRHNKSSNTRRFYILCPVDCIST